jgi:hypothetical protein
MLHQLQQHRSTALHKQHPPLAYLRPAAYISASLVAHRACKLVEDFSSKKLFQICDETVPPRIAKTDTVNNTEQIQFFHSWSVGEK